MQNNYTNITEFIIKNKPSFFENTFNINPKGVGQKIPFKLNKSQRVWLKLKNQLEGEWYKGKPFPRYSVAIVKTRQNGFTTMITRDELVTTPLIMSDLNISGKFIYTLNIDSKVKDMFEINVLNVFDNLIDFRVEGSDKTLNLLEDFNIKIKAKNAHNITLEHKHTEWRADIIAKRYEPDLFRGEPPTTVIFDEAGDIEDSENLKKALEPTMHAGSKVIIMGTAKTLTYEGKPNILKRYGIVENDNNRFFVDNHHVLFLPWYLMEDSFVPAEEYKRPLQTFILSTYHAKYNLHNVYDPELERNISVEPEQLNWIDKKYREAGNLIALNNEYPITLESAFEASSNSVFFAKWLSNAGKVTKYDLFKDRPCRITAGIDVGGIGEGGDKTIMCVNFDNKYFKFFDCSVDKTRPDHEAVANYLLNILTTNFEFKDCSLELISVDGAGIGGALLGILKTRCARLSVPVRDARFGLIQQDDYSGMSEYSKRRCRYRFGRDLMIDNIKQLFIGASTDWVETENEKGMPIVIGGIGIDYESCNNQIKYELELITQNNFDPVRYTDAHELREFLKGKSADYLSSMMCSVAYNFNEFTKYQKPVSNFYDQYSQVRGQQDDEAFRNGYGQRIEF